VTSNQPSTLSVLAAATEHDRPVLDRLWVMFQHDMSRYTRAVPDHAGRFRKNVWMWRSNDPDWRGYILRRGPADVGLAVSRGLNAPVLTINSVFLVQGARRRGNGLAAVATVTRAQPGKWQVAFQDANGPAAAFWQKVASQADDNWTFERRAVPGLQDVPPDAWITFNVHDPSR
jgi:predicted acetyltransferase